MRNQKRNKKNNKATVYYLPIFVIVCFPLFFSGCSAKTLLNNVEISDSCKDFDLSTYELYQLEAEITPQPALRDYLEEHFFIRKEEAKPLESPYAYRGIKAEGEDLRHETLEWDDELTYVHYNDAFDLHEEPPETMSVPIKEEVIEQAEKLLKEFPLDVNTDFKMTCYNEKIKGPYRPELTFSQTPEGIPISTRQRVDGVVISEGFINIAFYKNKLIYLDCVSLMKIKEKEPFSTVNAIPQNTERISTMVTTYLRKLGDSGKFTIEDISIVYGITKIEDEKYTLTPMIEVQTLHKKEDRNVNHCFQIELNTGTVSIW